MKIYSIRESPGTVLELVSYEMPFFPYEGNFVLAWLII